MVSSGSAKNDATPSPTVISGYQINLNAMKPITSVLHKLQAITISKIIRLNCNEQVSETVSDRQCSIGRLKGCQSSKCAADLKEFEEKLAKLSPLANNKAVKLWKNIKATLQERDLVKMSRLIQQHVAALSLQMQIIERYAFLDIP